MYVAPSSCDTEADPVSVITGAVVSATTGALPEALISKNGLGPVVEPGPTVSDMLGTG